LRHDTAAGLLKTELKFIEVFVATQIQTTLEVLKKKYHIVV
jgi:hypothetical protein